MRAEPDARRGARSDTRSPRRRGPGRPGRRSVTSFFATPPVEVIVTTITTDGWSRSTSTWRTVAVSSAGRRDEREQPRHLAEHLGRRLQRRLDLAPHRGQVERETRRPRLLPFEHLVRRRSGSRLSVGIRPADVCGCVSSPSDSSSASSLRTVDGETREPGPLDERLRADRLAGRDVLLDDAPEDVALASVAHLAPFAGNLLSGRQASSSAVTPPPRKRPRGVSAQRRRAR